VPRSIALSVAQLSARLLTVVVPSGKGSDIAALLTRGGGYSFETLGTDRCRRRLVPVQAGEFISPRVVDALPPLLDQVRAEARLAGRTVGWGFSTAFGATVALS
jgi:hypothetical protein